MALTFDQTTTDILTANNVPVVMLRAQQPEENKDAVALLADLFETPDSATRYAEFFDQVLARVVERLAGVPEEQRPRMLYINPGSMSQPHLIAEWWMRAGGTRSVTDDGRSTETLPLTTEFVLGADPDVIVVADPKDIAALHEDANLSQLRDVREGRIHVTPVAAHIWGNRTSEQPLSVLWMATQLHPELFPETELQATVGEFYRKIFRAPLGGEQIAAILAAGVTD